MKFSHFLSPAQHKSAPPASAAACSLITALAAVLVNSTAAVADNDKREIAFQFNSFSTSGLPKLREHVLQIPDLKKVIEKDTELAEALYLQRLSGTPYFRGGDCDNSEHFYKLGEDWKFQPIAAAALPPRASFAQHQVDEAPPVLAAKFEMKIEAAPDHRKKAITTIYKNGSALGQFILPRPAGAGHNTPYFFNNGRSLLVDHYLIRDTSKPQPEALKLSFDRGPFGDPHQATLYGISRRENGHCILYRYNLDTDANPVQLTDLGCYTGGIHPFAEECIVWENQRLLLISREQGKSVVVDLKTGAQVCRLDLPEERWGNSVLIVPGADGKLAFIGNRLVDLTSGALKATAPGLYATSSRKFSPDGKLLIYDTSEVGNPLSMTKLQLFDLSSQKVVGAADLDCQVGVKKRPIPPGVHQFFFIDKEHLLVTTGSQAVYLDNYHPYE